MRYIIKYVSVDGLVRFEERETEHRPEEILRRVGAYTPTFSRLYATEENELPPMRMTRREYRLYEHGIHEETGQYIFTYKEMP